MYSRELSRITTARPIEEADRRAGERHTLRASAEAVELHSGAHFSTRTTDWATVGALWIRWFRFLSALRFHVKVRQGDHEFETAGAVVYSQAGLGMGVAFGPLGPERRMALDSWIRRLLGEREVTGNSDEMVRSLAKVAQAGRVDHAALVRLVQLLIGKGILTEAKESLCFTTRSYKY
jgi:hypothetical protein